MAEGSRGAQPRALAGLREVTDIIIHTRKVKHVQVGAVPQILHTPQRIPHQPEKTCTIPAAQMKKQRQGEAPRYVDLSSMASAATVPVTPAIRMEAVRMLGCGGPSAHPPAQWEPQRLPSTYLWAQSSGRQTSLKDRPPGYQKNTVPMATIASTHRTTLLRANVWLFHTNHPLCNNADTRHGLGALWFHSVLTVMTRVSPT